MFETFTCEFCHDSPELSKLHLRARCHPTAPLRVELQSGILSLFCYIPSCNRLVARLEVAEHLKPTGEPPCVTKSPP